MDVDEIVEKAVETAAEASSDLLGTVLDLAAVGAIALSPIAIIGAMDWWDNRQERKDEERALREEERVLRKEEIAIRKEELALREREKALQN